MKVTYPKDSAGSKMTSEVPVVFESDTILDIQKLLQDKAKTYATINYVYVLNAAKQLVGVLSVRDILTLVQASKAGDVCTKKSLVYVHPYSHQEKAAFAALKNNIKAVPVIDKQKVFLGEIAADTILTILHKEMHEDALRRVGIRHPDAVLKNVLHLSIWDSFRHRIPWLIIGLIGGVFAAGVIGLFEEVLSRNLKIGSFLPLIVYMSSAVGLQMEASIIRDIAAEKNLPFFKYFVRHCLVVSCIAILLSILLFSGVGILHGDWYMAGVVAIALFAAVLSSVWISLIIPYIFSKLSYDPADASGPLATILQDIFSIVIYLGIASFLLL